MTGLIRHEPDAFDRAFPDFRPELRDSMREMYAQVQLGIPGTKQSEFITALREVLYGKLDISKINLRLNQPRLRR